MGLPILPHEQRPYLRLKKRTGTFPNGSTTYDPMGDFTVIMNESKPTVLEAVVDNTVRYGTARYIDSLQVGDSIIAIIKDSSDVEHAAFYGLVESLEYSGEVNQVTISAVDNSVYGENVWLNSIIYQKFIPDLEVSLLYNGTKYYTTLPAHTTKYAPIVLEMRQTYGCPLKAAWNGGGQANNNHVHHKAIPVYSAPTPSGFELRTVGGLGRPDYTDSEDPPVTHYYPEDTNPDSTVEKPTSTRYGNPLTTNITSNRISTNRQHKISDGARKFVAQAFTPYQDDQLTWLYFNVAKMIRRYPSQMSLGKAKNALLSDWATQWELATGDPAAISAISGAYVDGAGFYHSNWWDSGHNVQAGMYGFTNLVGLPQGGPIDTANFGQPFNTFGPGMDLKVTLVKCVKASTRDSDDSTTATSTPEEVPKGTMVPTSDIPFAYGGDSITGITWENDRDAEGTPDFGNVEVISSIVISATDPVPAPHYPAGAVIMSNYGDTRDEPWGGSMMDEGQQASFTQFGWNLESSPVSVEKGETYALIFEMLGDPAHPKMDDGVDIGGVPNPGGYLTPACWWAVGGQMNSASADRIYSTNTKSYNGGELMLSVLTDASGNIIGSQGEGMYNPLYRSKVGYSITYGTPLAASPHLNQAGPAITGANFGHWEVMDRMSSQKAMSLGFDLMLKDSGGTEYTAPPESLIKMEYFSGLNDRMNLMFSAIGGGWRILGENLYWKLKDGEIRYDAGSADWTPTTDIGSIKLIKMDYYSNPPTGGLLRAADKSTVRDVVHAICAKVPQFAAIIVDGTGNGLDDVYGTGFNDVATHELSYWSAVNESAWDSLQRLAGEYDAKLSIKTNMLGANTILFEAKTTMTDFVFSAPGAHQYTVSNREEDGSNLKYLRYSRMSQDVGNMYTRFRIIGASPSNTTNAPSIPGLPSGDANDIPIVWILDVPDMEVIVGYKKEYEFKSQKNITSFEIAKKAAQALKIIYAQDQYSGSATLVGLHPIYNNASYGMMFDTNGIIRIMDKYAVTGNEPTGLTNVFRITGIEYDSKNHTTDIKLTTVIDTGDYVSARTLIKNLKKNVQDDAAGRNFSELVQTTDSRTYATTGWTATLKTSGPPIVVLGEATGIEIVDGDGEFYVVASWPAGVAHIITDNDPATIVEIYDPTTASGTEHLLESSVFKWSKDNLTVIVRYAKL